MTELAPEPTRSPAALPTFALSYGVDDLDEPTRVTVYSDELDEIATHWITVDVDHANSIGAIA